MTEPKKKRAPTLKDVALLAGVSPMAVSTVVNRTKSTVGVSESTRDRILRAVEELQYRPNSFARSLRSNRTGTIGFFNGSGYFDTADPFIRSVFDGLTQGIATHGHDLLLHNSVYADRRELVIQRVLGGKIDGVILLATPGDASLLEELRRGALPSIVIAEPPPGLCSVVADDDGGSRAVARHLLSRGRRRVLYRRSAIAGACEQIRFDAFRTEMERAGAETVAVRAHEITDALTDEERAILLDPSSGITAVACWRDHSAARTLRFCLRHGIDVPGRVAITGFDGLRETSLPEEWTVTTFDANWYKIGVRSAELILNLVDGEPVPEVTIIPGSLSVGRTT